MPLIKISDIWIAKEFFALIFIFAICGYGISRGVKVISNNPFVNLFLLFLPLSIFNAPPYELMLAHQNLGNLWIWKATGWLLAYYIFYLIVKDLRIKESNIVFCISWAAIISAIYAFIQPSLLNIDQFQATRTVEQIGHPKSPEITAMIGNPTYLGCFLALCFPFILIYKKWWWSVLVFGAILLCQSDFAVAGAIIAGIFIVCMRSKGVVLLKVLVALTVFFGMFLYSFWDDIRPKIVDNGRFSTWGKAFSDWKSPPILMIIPPNTTPEYKAYLELLNKRSNALTGRGPGSFPYLFSVKYNNKWDDPHNVYLRCLYEYGLFGLILLIGMIGFVFVKKFAMARQDKFTLACYSSLIFICLASVGIPLLHIEPLRFFCILIFTLIS